MEEQYQEQSDRLVHTDLAVEGEYLVVASYEFPLVLAVGSVVELEPERPARPLEQAWPPPRRFEVTGSVLKLGKDRYGTDTLVVSLKRLP